MKIPEVRMRLSSAANDLRSGKRSPEKIANHLDFLVTELWRRKPRARKGNPRDRVPMTPELKRQIIAFAKKHPKLDQQEVAIHFNVNAGRVSEITSGFRK